MTLTLDNYKTFDSIADLNEAIRLHLREHQYKLNATAIKTLEVVSRHAVKYPGAAWLKIDTLVKLIGKSAPTVRRALALLERLGIIERVAFMRPKRGGNGGNILRIVVGDRASVIGRANLVEPTGASVEAPKESIEALSSLKKPINIPKQTLQPAQEAPATFYEHVKALIADKKDRREYFTAYKKQAVSLLRFEIYADQAELLNVIAIKAFYIALKRQQTGTIDNSVGYFYGTLRNQIDQALFADIHEVYTESPDTLLAALPY